MTRHVLVGVVVVAAVAVPAMARAVGPVRSAPGAADYAYSGDLGPGFWGGLRPGWMECDADRGQSPIDLGNAVGDAALGPLDLDVGPSPIELTNNGHTIEGEYAPGSTLRFEGEEYELLQYHFHTLSEHTVRGERAAMEMHAVFASTTSDDLAVVSQLYRLGPENPFLARFDEDLPPLAGDTFSSPRRVDLEAGLADTSRYYTYAGSLTTPPCSPIVTWIVLETWATLSTQQLQSFRGILGNDFRPLQSRSGRLVRTTIPYRVRPHARRTLLPRRR